MNQSTVRTVLSESEMTKEWAIDYMDYIISHENNVKTKELDLAYDIYEGVRNLSNYEYLTKQFGLDFPADLKHYPLIRPKLEQLKGEEWKRALNFVLYVEDDDSIKRKKDEQFQAYIKNIANILSQGIKEGDQVVQTEMAKLEKKAKLGFQTNLEIGVSKFLKVLIVRLGLKDKFADLFEDQVVVGSEYYRVQAVRLEQDPVFETLDSRKLNYPEGDNTRWLKDKDWCTYEEPLSISEILDRWGMHMSTEDINKLIEQYEYGYGFENSMDMVNMGGDIYRSSSSNSICTAYHCEFKAMRKINVLDSDDLNEDVIEVLDVLNDEELVEIPKKKKKFVKYRYIQERWEGVRIGSDIYINVGRSKYQVRSRSNPAKVPLTFNGRTSNTKGGIPYSLVLKTRHLQDLYDILHFHEENLIALSGSKGTVVDMSQIPDFKTDKPEDNLKMFMYYKKLGILFIDRNQDGADKSFNQFTAYDDSLSAGIQYIQASMARLEAVAGRITGINDQRVGAVSQYEGKAVTETALVQSSMNTEPIFKEHYMVAQEALIDVLNTARFCYPSGVEGAYQIGSFSEGVFSLNSNWSLSDYGIHLTTSPTEERNMNEMKALSSQLIQNQLLDPDDLFKIFTMDSAKEIQVNVEDSLDQKRNEAQQQQQQQQKAEQQQIQAEQARIAQETKLKEALDTKKLEIDEFTANTDRDYKKASVELDRERVELEREQLQATIEGKLQSGNNSAEIKDN